MVSVFSRVLLVEGTLEEGEMGKQLEMLSWKAGTIDVSGNIAGSYHGVVIYSCLGLCL